MVINKPQLTWEGKLRTLYLTSIENIILHHTAHPTWNIYETHRYHQRIKGWAGIGYNFFIELDGTIFEGRGFNIGAGATGYNYNSLHICFAGNFENTKPTESQIKSGKELIEYLLKLIPQELKILSQCDIGNTVCPGKYFPLEDFKSIKKDMEEEEMRYQSIEEVPEYAKATIQKLIDKNILKGKENGLDLSEDMIRMFVINDRAELYN